MLQVDSQHPAVKCHSGGVLIIYHAAISLREGIERRQRRKITRNVLGSERELRIERFMTAGFASRPLGEVGGVSRNRLLVDKMIVWRTILGLIMASKWPEPESQSACRFSNDRRQGLVINANKLPRCALLRQESPASIS